MSNDATRIELAEVSKRAVSVAPHQPVHDLLALFQQDPGLLIIAVADAGVFLGSVSRKDLLTLMSGKFAMDLYARKPVGTLLDDLSGEKVVLRPELDINQAALRLLSLDPTLQTDAFPLVRNGHCVGVVAVCDLVRVMAQRQGELLETLGRFVAELRAARKLHGIEDLTASTPSPRP
jgi:phosphoserine phosphatase RsbU/P